MTNQGRRGKPRKGPGKLTKLAKIRIEKGFTLEEAGKAVHSDRTTLMSLEKGRIPRNHPMIPHWAKFYGLTPQEMVPLMAKRDMGPSILKRLGKIVIAPSTNGEAPNGQVAGTDPFSHVKRPRRAKGGKIPIGLAGVRYAKGLTGGQIAEASGIHLGRVRDIELHHSTLPTDDPRFPKLAAAYGISVEELKSYMRKKGKKSKSSKQETEADTIAPGKRLAAIKTPAVAAKGAYNKLRKISIGTRQFVRTLATTTNIAAMKGDRFINLPPIPVPFFADMLSDYMSAKGISDTMMLSPDWAEHFDKR